MIYLIGGSPRCGKTILAKKLARDRLIPWISTDAIRSMILMTVPKSTVQKRFPQENMEVPEGKFRFDIYSANAMLRAQYIEAKTMWLPIKALIVHLINSDQEHIIEGIHLFPKFVNTLKKEKYWNHIRVVYLVKTDAEKIKSGFYLNKSRFDWMLPAIKNEPSRIYKAVAMVKIKSDYIEKEANKFRLKVFNTEDNFNQQLDTVQHYLLD